MNKKRHKKCIQNSAIKNEAQLLKLAIAAARTQVDGLPVDELVLHEIKALDGNKLKTFLIEYGTRTSTSCGFDIDHFSTGLLQAKSSLSALVEAFKVHASEGFDCPPGGTWTTFDGRIAFRLPNDHVHSPCILWIESLQEIEPEDVATIVRYLK